MRKYFALAAMSSLLAVSCNEDDDTTTPPIGDAIELMSHSKSPVLLKKTSEFSNIEIYNLLSSEDTYIPDFLYGSMADGAGLLRNDDGTFTLINNIEADYSIARITLDETFKPIKGEYIVNSTATAHTAQCSGSLVTPEEHGFGPTYLSGGEWGGSSKGVFQVDPYKAASTAETATMLPALGQWSTENAVVIGKDAYANKTVVFIGDDQSDNETPKGQLAMYVGDRGNLSDGKLYSIKAKDAAIDFEVKMEEGKSYDVEFVELEERTFDKLQEECEAKGIIGFSRVEDIDWRRGSGASNREIYFAVTGREKDGLVGKGTISGRIYKLEMNENDPTGPAKLTCVLDGDKEGGKAAEFHSPDNIVVTNNYAYIQEDPNGLKNKPEANHFARLYQYNLNTGELKTVLECDQDSAAAQPYMQTTSKWEITGMIDISETIGVADTFLVITQNHSWRKDEFRDADKDGFDNLNNGLKPDDPSSGDMRGSMLYVVKGLNR